AVDGIRAFHVTGVQTCALPICFLDPFSDVSGTGYQAANSIYAFATGGWWGTGLGASQQKWGQLPEAHTDFIFSILGEELGLPGALMVLLLIFTLGYAGIRIAMRTRDKIGRAHV